MTQRSKFAPLAVLALAAFIASCGGNDSAPAASGGASIGGVAATGAPIAGAVMTVTCAGSPNSPQTTTAAADGTWSVTVTNASDLPCLVKATGGTPPVTLYSVAKSVGVVNVTPLTNLVVSAAMRNADPAAWLTANGTAGLAALDLATAQTNLKASLTTAGYTLPTGDLLTSSFKPQLGDPLDDLLEAVADGLANGGTSYATLVTQVAAAGPSSTVTLPPSTVVAYNSLPDPFPSNIPSYGPEAYGLQSLGDRINFADGTPRKVRRVTVAMSSWACMSGSWNLGTCSTEGEPTFSHPVTLSIYDSTMTLVTTVTQTFAMPYRPSKDASCTGGRWKDAAGNCFNGKAFKIAFDLANVTLPAQVIYKLSYNTRTAGPAPIGGDSGPYDSLNIAVYSHPAASPSVGTAQTPGSLYWNGVQQAEDAGLMARFDMVP